MLLCGFDLQPLAKCVLLTQVGKPGVAGRIVIRFSAAMKQHDGTRMVERVAPFVLGPREVADSSAHSRGLFGAFAAASTPPNASSDAKS